MTKISKSLITLLFVLSSAFAQADDASDKQHDCILMTGAQVAATGLSLSHSGYGDADYWLRTFTLLRDNANGIAATLSQSVIPSMKCSFLAVAMQEIVKDIQSAPQTGRGDSAYWSHETSEQSRIYGRAAEKIMKMKEVTCN